MSWKKKLFFSLLSTALIVVLGNLCCALGERLAYGAFWGQDRPKGLYIHQTGERPRLQPNASLNGWLYQISINSLGFRGKELENPKPKDSFRIWCMGGSTTFDIFSDTDDNTWPAQTEQILTGKFPAKKIEVLNAGVPGEVLFGSTEDFRAYQKDIRADAVVIYHGPNDLRQLLAAPRQQQLAHQQKQMGKADHQSPFGFILDRKDFVLIRVLRRNLKESLPIPSEWDKNQMSQQQLNDMRRRLEQTIQTVRRNRAIPILATHALKGQDGDTGAIAKNRVAETTSLLRMPPEQVIKTFYDYNQMVRALAVKYKTPVADVRTAVGPQEENWGDGTHFAPPGSALAAEEVARAISEIIK